MKRSKVPAMRVALSALAVAVLAPAVAHASSDDTILAHGCSDTVVVATVGDGTQDPADSTGNLLGSGWFWAPLNVQKMVRGEPLPAVVQVRYFAQSPLEQNQEFMLVLKNTASGYEVQAAQLMRKQPVLAGRCQ